MFEKNVMFLKYTRRFEKLEKLTFDVEYSKTLENVFKALIFPVR